MSDAIVHQGWATKSGGRVRSWKKRFFVLRENGTVAYYEKPSSPEPQGVLDLHRASAVLAPAECEWGPAYHAPPGVDQARRLEIVTEERKFPIFCDTGEEASEWADKLKQVYGKLKQVAEKPIEELAADAEILSGWATKSGGRNKTWHRRHFILRANGTLSYYNKITSPHPTGVIDLRHCVQLNGPSDCNWGLDYNISKSVPVEHRFEVITRERKFPIYCESPEEATRWVEAIAKVRDRVSSSADKVDALLETLDAGEMAIADDEDPNASVDSIDPAATVAADPPTAAAEQQEPVPEESSEDVTSAETKEEAPPAEAAKEEPEAAEPAAEGAPAAAEAGDEPVEAREGVDPRSVPSMDRLSVLGLPSDIGAGTIIHQGWATKAGGKIRTWRRRFFELRGDGTLSYWSSTDTQLPPMGVIDLKQAKKLLGPGETKSIPSWPFSSSPATRMAIVFPTRNYAMYFDSPEETEAWIERLILVCEILGLEADKHRRTSLIPEGAEQVAAAAEEHGQEKLDAVAEEPKPEGKPEDAAQEGKSEDAAAAPAPEGGAAAPEAAAPEAAADTATEEAKEGGDAADATSVGDVSGVEVKPNRSSSSSSIKASGDIIYSGWLMKLGAKVKSWKRRWFQLRNDGFMTYARTCGGVAIGVIDMRSCTSLKYAEECDDWPDAPKTLLRESRFELDVGGRTFQLYASSAQDASSWLNALSGACLFSGVAVSQTREEDDEAEGDEVVEGEGEGEGDDDDDDEEGSDSTPHTPLELKTLDLSAAPSDDDVEAYFSFFGTPKTKANRAIFEAAANIGRAKAASGEKSRHATVIYNPVSGAGRAKLVVETMVLPVLRLGGMVYTVLPTQYAGHCREFVQNLDLTTTDSIVICGGDGLVSEGVTGFMNRPDAATASQKVPVGIVAVGTANAMAHELDGGRATTPLSLCGWAAVAVARGTSKPVDVVAVHSRESVTYGLSCIGWGLAGAVALRAEQLRWVPGQRKARYDIAGFVTITKDWPIACRCTLEYPEYKTTKGQDGKEETTKVWQKSKLGVINLIASNVAKLGIDHPIHPDMKPDDGHIIVAILPEGLTLQKTVSTALSMKQGKWLAQHKLVLSVKVREFKITPEPDERCSDIPYNIDGDPKAAQPIHVRVMQKALNVHWNPPDC